MFSYTLVILFIFLQSGVLLSWFTVDPILLGFVGIAAVVVFVVETVFAFRGRPLRWPFNHSNPPNPNA